jgi:hypothetical protein
MRILSGGFLLAIALALFPSPSKSWEESDKSAFIEKITIVKEQIDKQPSVLKDKLTPRQGYAAWRKYCLLQSVGIDIVHHYLQMNPGDQEWRQYYDKVRNKLTECLYVMYEIKKQVN